MLDLAPRRLWVPWNDDVPGLAIPIEELTDRHDRRSLDRLWRGLRGVQGGSSTPGFAATVNNGSGLVAGTADTSLTAPTNVTTLLTAGASGSRVDELRHVGVGTTVASMVNIFAHDGSTYHLVDQITVTVVTSSTTAPAFKDVRTYANLLLKTGWSLRITNTVAGNVSLIKGSAFGGDY
jgi:hypothetical protein